LDAINFQLSVLGCVSVFVGVDWSVDGVDGWSSDDICLYNELFVIYAVGRVVHDDNVSIDCWYSNCLWIAFVNRNCSINKSI